MANGKKNRFSALAGKDKCEETECQLFEKTVAEAVEEALNKENDQKLTVSAKQPAKGKKKTGPTATTPTGAGDGAMIGDIIVQVIAAIQPILIKSVITAVTVAVATAFKQMREELQEVETMKGEVERVRENMARLQAKLQTQHFDLDRQEQYSRKDSVRIYSIPEAEDERETNDIVVKLAKDIGVNITTADLSVNHRLGRRGRGGKPRTIIAKFVRRQCKTDVMRNKKRLRDCQNYENVYINDDLTTLRNKLVMEMKKDDNIKQVWTIEGRIFCIQMDQGREVKRVVDSPEDLFKVGWSEQRVAEMGVYGI